VTTEVSIALTPFVGEQVDDVMDDLLDAIIAAVPGTSRSKLLEYLDCYGDMELDEELHHHFSQVIGGNEASLKKGRAILPFSGSLAEDKYMKAVVEGVDLRGIRSVFQVSLIEGREAGERVVYRTRDFAYFGIQIGVPKRLIRRANEIDLKYLWFMAKIQIRRNIAYVGEAKLNAESRKHNREILRMRLQECPRNMLHKCHECNLGRDQCPAAIRLKTRDGRP